MDRMFRVLGFWCLVMALMFMAGKMNALAGLFAFQTALFFLLGYLRFTERTYMVLFGGYMLLSFTGMVFWSFFMMG